MPAITQDTLMYYDSGKLKKIPAAAEITLSGASSLTAGALTATGTVTGAGLLVNGNGRITGDLYVEGDLVSVAEKSLVIGDNFIDLNAANTLTGATNEIAGGFSVNILAATAAVATISFTAGTTTPTPSPAYVMLTGDVTLDYDAGRIMQISGTPDGSNVGQYVVDSSSVVDGNTKVIIKGVGSNAISAQTPFAHNNFTSSTGPAAVGSAVVANMAVFAISNGKLNRYVSGGPSVALAPGTPCYGYGTYADDFINGWTSLAPASAATLQSAYDASLNPATISGVKPLNITTSEFGVEASTLDVRGTLSATFSGPEWYLGSPSTLTDVGHMYGSFRIATVDQYPAGDVEVGHVITYNPSGSGYAPMSSADSNSIPYGVALSVAGGVEVAVTGAFLGYPVKMKYTGLAPSPGAPVYLSSTPGCVSGTPPASGRIYSFGSVSQILAGSLVSVNWNPQYIADV